MHALELVPPVDEPLPQRVVLCAYPVGVVRVVFVDTEKLQERRTVQRVLWQLRVERTFLPGKTLLVTLDRISVAPVPARATTRALHADDQVYERGSDQHEHEPKGTARSEQLQAAQAEHEGKVTEDVAHGGR